MSMHNKLNFIDAMCIAWLENQTTFFICLKPGHQLFQMLFIHLIIREMNKPKGKSGRHTEKPPLTDRFSFRMLGIQKLDPGILPGGQQT